MLYYIAVLPFILGLIALKWGRIGMNISDSHNPIIIMRPGWKKDRASFWIAVSWFLVSAIMVAMQWDYNNAQYVVGGF